MSTETTRTVPVGTGECKSRKPERAGWSHLLQYTILVLAVGVLTGYFLTLCPNTGWRGAKWTAFMFVSYGALWMFVIGAFLGIGYSLKQAKGSDH